jgi:citrate/tricarballylate utilization protein
MDASRARQQPSLLHPDLLAEADRIFTICNACRYCEGVCPVFPALERREAFEEQDVLFLGNLCHDCRACWYVCPYTDPHEFNVNVPAVMTAVREQTYGGYAWPTAVGKALSMGWRGIAAVAGVLLVGILLAIGRFSESELIQAQTGAGAFYIVVPWLAMFVPTMVMTIYAILVMVVAAWRFWRATDTPLRAFAAPGAARDAAGDALGLRHLAGGGPGCYTDERPRQRRRLAHQLVFYGFALTFASTVAAFVQQEVLGWLPPYSVLSVPVVLGTVGGVMAVIGCIALLRLKSRSDESLGTLRMRALDLAFLWVLLALNVDGLLLLVARETVLMPFLLATHLALVGAFFLTAPYGKFAHFVYRFGALVQHRLEARAEVRASDELRAAEP